MIAIIGVFLVAMSVACRQPASIGTLERADVAVEIKPDG
jgi:hypothetical protein